MHLNSVHSASSRKMFDLHIHSRYSYDSFLRPETIIRVAKKKGLNGVAVTDHGTIKGGLATKEVNDDTGFIVIVGTEIETEFGDVLGLFLEREIESRRFPEVCKEIREQGGLAVLAHPYRKGKVLPEDLFGYIDFVEGFNARSPRGLNVKAQELAEKYRVPVIAGSDAHLPFEIGRGRTILNGDVDALRHSEGVISVEGSESNYYLVHGLSILMEQFKRVKNRYLSGKR